MVQVVADVELTAHYSCQPMGRGLCSKSRAAGAPRASRGLTGPPHEVAQWRVRLLSRKSVGFGHFSEAACAAVDSSNNVFLVIGDNPLDRGWDRERTIIRQPQLRER